MMAEKQKSHVDKYLDDDVLENLAGQNNDIIKGALIPMHSKAETFVTFVQRNPFQR